MPTFTATIFVPGGNSHQHGNNGGAIGDQALISINRDPDHNIKDGEEVDDDLELTPIAGVDDDGVARFIKTDEDGNLTITTADGEVVAIQDLENLSFQNAILKQLKKMNLHMSLITNTFIENTEVE